MIRPVVKVLCSARHLDVSCGEGVEAAHVDTATREAYALDARLSPRVFSGSRWLRSWDPPAPKADRATVVRALRERLRACGYSVRGTRGGGS